MLNAYSVAVKISVIGGAASTLAGITAAMRTLHGQTGQAQRGMGSLNAQLLAMRGHLAQIRTLTLAGGALALAGGGVLKAMGGPLDAAKQYELAYTRFKTLNLGAEVNRQADEFSRGAQRFGVSSTQMMESLRGAYGIFGNMKMATAAAGKIAELNTANANLFGGKVGDLDSEAIRSLKRFIDIRGGTDSVASFMRTLDLGQKLVTGSGGDIQFRDLAALAKTGSTAFRSLSDQGVVNLASFMQEQGGFRAGTGIMSLYQNLISGRSTKQAMAAVQALGLGTIAQEKIGTVGGKVQTRNILNLNEDFAAMLRVDPVSALMKFVAPAITARYGSSPDVVAQEVNKILSNRRGSDFATSVTTQQAQNLRDARLVSNAMGADQTIAASRGTLGGNLANLQARWNSLLTELGTTILPIAVRGLEGLNAGLKRIIEWSREHPMLAKGVMGIAAAFGALAVAGGGLMLIAGGLKAVALAIGLAKGVGLAAAVGGLLGPIGLVVAALGGLALAMKVFGGDGKPKARPDFMPPGYQAPAERGADRRALDQLQDWRNRHAAPAPPRGNVTVVVGDVRLDGRIMGQLLTPFLSAELNRAPAGGSRFDPTMGPVYPSQALPVMR